MPSWSPEHRPDPHEGRHPQHIGGERWSAARLRLINVSAGLCPISRRYVNTTRLLGAGGRTYGIGSASPASLSAAISPTFRGQSSALECDRKSILGPLGGFGEHVRGRLHRRRQCRCRQRSPPLPYSSKGVYRNSTSPPVRASAAGLDPMATPALRSRRDLHRVCWPQPIQRGVNRGPTPGLTRAA